MGRTDFYSSLKKDKSYFDERYRFRSKAISFTENVKENHFAFFRMKLWKNLR